MTTDTITYAGENTGTAPTMECEGACDQHYVVRCNGIWWRAFHNERDARLFVEAATGARY